VRLCAASRAIASRSSLLGGSATVAAPYHAGEASSGDESFPRDTHGASSFDELACRAPSSVLAAAGTSRRPYAALAALAGIVRTRWVMVVAAIAVLGIDATALVGARSSASSTAGVALLITPFVALVTVAPTAAAVGWFVRRRRSPR
jgi:hypothetical protein